MPRDLRDGWNTLRLLFQIDRSAFLIGASTSVIQSMVYPLMLAVAPVVDVFLLILIPVSLAEARYHARLIELQTHSAPALFRMTYLTQKSVDAAWQRDIRVHGSTILVDEFRALARTYLNDLRA